MLFVCVLAMYACVRVCVRVYICVVCFTCEVFVIRGFIRVMIGELRELVWFCTSVLFLFVCVCVCVCVFGGKGGRVAKRCVFANKT